MACSSMTIPSSPTPVAAKDFKEHKGLRRVNTAKDLRKGATMRRSYSDNQFCCSGGSYIQASASQAKLKSSRSFGIFPLEISSSMIPNSIKTFLFEPETSKVDVNVSEKDRNVGESLEETNDGNEQKEVCESNGDKVKRANWVERIMELRRNWRNKQQNEDGDGDRDELSNNGDGDECEDGCDVDYNTEDEGEGEGGEAKYDREMFSRYLAPVHWSDIKSFSKLAFLCNMAYVIPEIKAVDLKKHYDLSFITSSLEKKAKAAAIKAKIEEDSTCIPFLINELTEHELEKSQDLEQKRLASRSSVAYEIAASAASYVQSRAKGLTSCELELKKDGNYVSSCMDQLDDKEDGESSPRVYKSEVAAYVAASTMTAMVAAGEKVKQEAAKDLQSLHSSPCEWFVCDDVNTYTRCFVIQGSDSLASWQANLFFEPTKFEGIDVLVHRGIYEAAKGIYEQFMPEIIEHLNTHGERAKLQFTGHSLGGSLALLVNLMLLTRNVVTPSTLRPVVTFGSPFVLCGGHKILKEFGLDANHVHCVMMHRDIVPRAFSCDYPNHVALVLKRLNDTFKSHPCLNKNKVLYSPLGKIFILQPDEKASPSHPLLPPGSALYALDKTRLGFSTSILRAFLNCPHPLHTLSDPTAYGSEGTILRDHDSSNYLKAVNVVLRQKTKLVARRVTKQRNLLWPLLNSPSPHNSWNQEGNLKSEFLLSKEVMSGA